MALAQDNPTPELLSIISELQTSVLAAHKDQKGYGYKYASLTSILKAIQPAKAKGLCHFFITHQISASEPGQPGQFMLELRLYHGASGGVLSSTRMVSEWDADLPSSGKGSMPKQQQAGSNESYVKRYMLADMFGIATDENEGETTVAPETTAAAVTPKQEQKPEPAGKLELVKAMALDLSKKELSQLLEQFGAQFNIKGTVASRHITTAEHVSWLKNQFEEYKLSKAANSLANGTAGAVAEPNGAAA